MIFGITIISQRAKWLLMGILTRVTNSDLEYLYENSTDIQKDLMSNIKNSSKVLILTARGNELKTETYNSILIENFSDKKNSIKILLPNPKIMFYF